MMQVSSFRPSTARLAARLPSLRLNQESRGPGQELSQGVVANTIQSPFTPIAAKHERGDGEERGGERTRSLASYYAHGANPATRGLASKLGGLSRRAVLSPQVGSKASPAAAVDTVSVQRVLTQVNALASELAKPGRGGKEQLASALPSLLAGLGGVAALPGREHEVTPATLARYLSALGESVAQRAKGRSPRVVRLGGRLKETAARLTDVMRSPSHRPPANKNWGGAEIGQPFLLHDFFDPKKVNSASGSVFSRTGLPQTDSRDRPYAMQSVGAFSSIVAQRTGSVPRVGLVGRRLAAAVALLHENPGRKLIVIAFRGVAARDRGTYISNPTSDLHRQFSNTQGPAVTLKGADVRYPPAVRIAYASPALAATAA